VSRENANDHLQDKILRVASVQFQHAPGDKEKNLETIRQFVTKAAADGVQLICFPECCISGYWHLRHLSREQLGELAEPVFDGPSSHALMELSRRYGMTIGAGLVELSDDGRLYNTYVVAMPDGRFVRHRKLHCFISQHMDSGDQFTVFDTPHGWRAGVLICYDNNLVENARITALAGAEVVVEEIVLLLVMLIYMLLLRVMIQMVMVLQEIHIVH